MAGMSNLRHRAAESRRPAGDHEILISPKNNDMLQIFQDAAVERGGDSESEEREENRKKSSHWQKHHEFWSKIMPPRSCAQSDCLMV
mmetsp:Transcript_23559/g.63614  ORF Transcript_23559/g.63614 Transcript_23559/m.63614 type:complete len:87 (-) Transcript_23559:71-331(-)